MLVRALRNGFYRNARVRQDQEFHLHAAEDISCLWMEPLDEEAQQAFAAKEAAMKADGVDTEAVKGSIIDVVTSRHELKHGSIAPGTMKRVNTHSTFGQAGQAKKERSMKKTKEEKLPKPDFGAA